MFTGAGNGGQTHTTPHPHFACAFLKPFSLPRMVRGPLRRCLATRLYGTRRGAVCSMVLIRMARRNRFMRRGTPSTLFVCQPERFDLIYSVAVVQHLAIQAVSCGCAASIGEGSVPL